jgi:hypothetical protein
MTAVRLIEWRMPTFKFRITYIQKIRFIRRFMPSWRHGGRDINVDLDTISSASKFIASEDKNFLDILDGFRAGLRAAGNEQPELQLTGTRGRSIGIGPVEVVRAGWASSSSSALTT